MFTIRLREPESLPSKSAFLFADLPVCLLCVSRIKCEYEPLPPRSAQYSDTLVHARFPTHHFY